MSENYENTPRCRMCGYTLSASDGCTFCLELKKHLLWPVLEDKNSENSAQAVINTSLSALRTRLTRVNKEIVAEGTSYDRQLTRDLTGLSRALKELAAEQRKLEDREQERYDKLGIQGKMLLFVREFFSKLPEDYQIKLLGQMRTCYERQNRSCLPDDLFTKPEPLLLKDLTDD